jgi:ADP-ribose pyrophosphatase YjhB (NUDIX family)
MLIEAPKFCTQCGTALSSAVRFGRPRPVCPACGWIYFADPKVAAAVLVEDERGLLLVQRVNEPQRGLWTLPAGFVDAGEDPAAAARRECQEETGLEIELTGLLDVIAGQEHPRGAHILIVYRGRVVGGALQAGDDAGQVGFFARTALPSLAFASTNLILQKHL